LYLFIESLPRYAYDHVYHVQVFILELRLVVRSMLFILCSPDLRCGRSVLTQRLIIGFTYVVCKHDGMWICDPCSDLTLFYLSLTVIYVQYVEYSSDRIASQKVKEK
jgi:hypothetical protein